MSDKNDLVEALLRRHGTTYCEELGIDIEKNQPSPLFCWLVASILFSSRIGAGAAAEAAKALFKAGWRTPQAMAQATWEERTRVLNRAGYARYDESTSRMLGDTSEHLIEAYDGDLRRLRERAGQDAEEERRLLQEFKGIGKVGADIFLREIQAVWPEVYPFADAKALQAAKHLKLGATPETLAERVGRNDFARFVAALVRMQLAKDEGGVRDEAVSD